MSNPEIVPGIDIPSLARAGFTAIRWHLAQKETEIAMQVTGHPVPDLAGAGDQTGKTDCKIIRPGPGLAAKVQSKIRLPAADLIANSCNPIPDSVSVLN